MILTASFEGTFNKRKQSQKAIYLMSAGLPKACLCLKFFWYT